MNRRWPAGLMARDVHRFKRANLLGRTGRSMVVIMCGKVCKETQLVVLNDGWCRVYSFTIERTRKAMLGIRHHRANPDIKVNVP